MKKSFDPILPSKVLLLCIDNKNNSILTQKYLYTLFSSFGTPKQILIFERGKVWKAFVEMDTEQNARNAKTKLHNQVIFSDGTKILVHYSTLEKISMTPEPEQKPRILTKNLTPQKGTQLSSLQQKEIHSIEKKNETFYWSPSLPTNDKTPIKTLMSSQSPFLVSETTYANSKEHFPSNKDENSMNSLSQTFNYLKCSDPIEEQKKKLKKAKTGFVINNETNEIMDMICEQKSYEDVESPIKKKPLNKEFMILFDIKDEMNFNEKIPLKKEEEVDGIEKHEQEEEDFRLYNSIFPTNKQFFLTPFPTKTDEKNRLKINTLNVDDFDFNNLPLNKGKDSSVILISGLESKEITIKMLFNIFSNFGNISSIVFSKKQKKAILVFFSFKDAEIAFFSLNEILFYGHKIYVSFTFYNEIEFICPANLSNEILLVQEKDHRFKQKNKKSIVNLPSNTLHISNLKTDACNYEIMFDLLKKFGKVEALKFKVLDHYKNMCLARFNSLEESIIAMANLHDYELCKRQCFLRF